MTVPDIILVLWKFLLVLVSIHNLKSPSSQEQFAETEDVYIRRLLPVTRTLEGLQILLLISYIQYY